MWLRLSLLCCVGVFGCTLTTDFDRDPPSGGLIDLPDPIPSPEYIGRNLMARAVCETACSIGQQCLYEEGIADCRFQPANIDINYHACVGTCVAEPRLVTAFASRRPDELECSAVSEDAPVVQAAQTLLCTPDGEPDRPPWCSSVFCGLRVGSLLYLELCLDVDLDADCTDACEALPDEFWRCSAQDAFFAWKQYRDANPGLEREAYELQLLQIFCDRIARCADVDLEPGLIE